MNIFKQELPLEWKVKSDAETTMINMYILLVLLFIINGWRIGVFALCSMIVIDCIGILINKYKYAKMEKEFKNYIMSGLIPCLIYVKSDSYAFRNQIIVDDKLPVFCADMEGIFIRPKIVFLSDKLKADFSNKCPDDVKKFYNEKIAPLPSYKPTDTNIAVIKAVLEYKKDLEYEKWCCETNKNLNNKTHLKKGKKCKK